MATIQNKTHLYIIAIDEQRLELSQLFSNGLNTKLISRRPGKQAMISNEMLPINLPNVQAFKI